MSADASRASVPVLPVSQELKTVGTVVVGDPLIQARDVSVYYGEKLGVKDVNIDIARNQVLAMIGPSGCGKSTFLRCLHRAIRCLSPHARCGTRRKSG
jgi:phosphate transport system ATP-binding protein